MAYTRRHLPITPVLLTQVDPPWSLWETRNRRFCPTALTVLLRQKVLPFLLLIPSQNLPKLLVQLSVAEEIPAFLHQPSCVNVILREQVDEFEEFGVEIAVVQRPFYAIKEHRFIVGYWEAVWLGWENVMTRSTRRSWGGDDMLGVIGQWSKVLCWGMSSFLCGDQRVFMAQRTTFSVSYLRWWYRFGGCRFLFSLPLFLCRPSFALERQGLMTAHRVCDNV